MKQNKEMGIKAKEGMRVHVYSAGGDEDLGEGTIDKVETLEVEETDLIILEYPSRILLDSGDVTEGLKCGWTSTGKEEDLWVKGEVNAVEDIKKAATFLSKDPCEKRGNEEK